MPNTIQRRHLSTNRNPPLVTRQSRRGGRSISRYLNFPMTPSVADFKSEQPDANGPPLVNFQVPSPKFAAHCQGEFNVNSTDSNTVDGFNGSNFVPGSSRSRRKHKKVKKQVGSRNGSVQTSAFVNNGFTDDLIASIGANSSGSVSKLNLGESVGGSSGGGNFERFESFDNIGFVVGDSSSFSVGRSSEAGEFGKFENMGFVFGASKDSSSMKADSKKLQKNVNVEKVGASLVKDCSEVDFLDGGNEKLEDSEVRANEFGKFSVSCAFGAIKSDGVSVSDLNAGNRDCTVSGHELGVGNVVFGASENNAVLNSKRENRQSGVSPPSKNVETFIEEQEKIEVDGRSENRKFNSFDFVFSASRKDSMSDANLRDEGIKGNNGESVNVRGTEKSNTGVVSDDASFMFPEKSNSSDGTNSKYSESWGKFGDACFIFGATPCDSMPSGNLEEKEINTTLENFDFVEGKQSVDNQTKYQGKVTGASYNGHGSGASFTNMVSDLKGKFNFVFGSMNNLGSGCMPVSNISDKMQALNLHDHAKVNGANNSKDYSIDQGAKTSNVFMFGSDRKNVSSSGSQTTYSCDQHNDICKPGLWNGCAIPQNEGVGNVHAFGESFTDFSTPNLNLSYSFTANLVPDLNKKLEFSLNSSNGDIGLKKTRRKFRQQNLVRQRAARTNELKEEEFQQGKGSPGCSPMDFSPYQDTNCEPSSIKESTKERDGEFDGDKSQFCFPSTSTNSVKGNFEFSATPIVQDEVSSTQPRHQKKYKMKIGHSMNGKTSSRKVDKSNEQSTGANISNTSRQEDTEATHDACQKWRIRGNQAYKDGDLSKAETCYTKGVQSNLQKNTSGLCSESRVLCYSNRAATRISLGRLREALEDCKMAASLDPTFIKVYLRAANCHLVLGEVEDATYNYNKCLETITMVCLDRKITIEAADGLQKAQKVVDCRRQSTELLQQKTYDSASKALGVIAEALAISCYSEKLLELKGEALLLLRKHEDVIQLCEQTLAFAEKNFTMTNGDAFASCKSPKLWRWGLLSRSYFSMGRLDKALDLIEKQEHLRHGGGNLKSSSMLAVTIRELLHCKNAGNEAFQCGRYTEAIEHYTSAITKSVESRPFAAVCISNRAASHQALGELIDAIADCSLAIALDGNYSKALSRRATLHETIRDYGEAANDLRKFISILEKQSSDKSQLSGTPTTGSSVKDLRRARRRLSALEEKAKKGFPLDHYLILGLKASDSSSEVKKAYRKAALRHHPDKAGQVIRSECGGDDQQWKEILEKVHIDADRLFKMIGEANAVLSDSTKRSKYDDEEEMRRDDQENSGSTSRSSSNYYYSSPFESSNSNREWRKAYGESRYWKTHGNSTRW